MERSSAKRQREDLGSEPVARHSEKFWFDDGSVVLQVESTQFRVHRSILAKYSSVFDDLFKVPQPEGDESGWVDGCPTVYMYGDTTEDWDSVLSFIYTPSLLSLKWPDVSKLASMMRLGKKYQMDDIFEEALTRLKAQYPKNLHALDVMTYDGSGTEFHEWISTHFQVITRLGEEMALWSILPITYYVAARYESTPALFLRYRNLSPNTLRSIASGTSVMWEDIVNYSFIWMEPLGRMIPTDLCLSRDRCMLSRTFGFVDAFMYVRSQDVGIALAPYYMTRKSADLQFCAECLKAIQKGHQGARAYIWNNLARYFFGDNWEKLEDTKSDLWPSIWEPR